MGDRLLLRRMSGLCLPRLALVGDANEGRFGDAPGTGGDSVGVVDSTGTDVVDDVLRRLGAEISIAVRDGFMFKSYSRHAVHVRYSRRCWCDASSSRVDVSRLD
jgi:hypothetical protein